ncbi:16S rRNA (cytosine(967)-C(5))-methyltransferase RsmB [candidate division WOR-3 bacterium]|nr:16S rRNA (cytosine(967)-C(5))-methyltransferase RsmB [candidate division WOR-3 bacterium]
MESGLKGRELALKFLIEFEKKGITIKDFLDSRRENSVKQSIQKAYDYFYGCVRLRKRLDYILKKHLKKYDISELPIPIRNVLRLGVYGLEFSHDPEYAVVDTLVTLARKYGHNGTASLVNGVLRNLHRVEYPEERIEYLSIFYSFPEWMVIKLVNIYGGDTEKILDASNQPPGISIRVNRLKITPSKLQEQLMSEGVETKESNVSKYNLLTDSSVLYTRAFQEGLFQVQSVTQTLITEMLSPKRGEIVLDLCSSPGGKSTGIAEIMGDEGMILSVDIKNLDKVVCNCRRLDLQSVFPIRADARKFYIRNARRIMLDVPCSGTGVMAARGDLRWNVKPETIESLKILQLELLSTASQNLHRGGSLVYATCSILPEENEEQLYRFLEENPDFKLEPLDKGEPFLFKIPGFGTPNGGFGAIIRREN